MSSETPLFASYQAVVEQAQEHTLIGLQGELTTTDATIQLILAAIKAFQNGVSQDEIVTALIEGEVRGVNLYSNLRTRNDRDYWREVQAEAEAFWAKR